MPAIEFKGSTVHLRPQKRPAFEEITALVFDEPDDDREPALIYAQKIVERLASGCELEDPVVQAGLWSLHDLGIRGMRDTSDGSGVAFTERIETAAARGEPSYFAFASLRDGRAFSAAIVNIRNRSMLLNGEPRPIRRNPRLAVEAVMKLIASNRLVDEDLIVTTVRVLVTLLEQPPSDEMEGHVACALEIAMDLGVRELAIDQEGSVELGRLDVGNALASAVLQGLEPSEVLAIRRRLEGLNQQYGVVGPG